MTHKEKKQLHLSHITHNTTLFYNKNEYNNTDCYIYK